MRSVNDSAGKSRQTAQSYHPVWMANWTRTSSNTSSDRRTLSACPEEKHDPVVNESLRTSSKESKPLFGKDGIHFLSKIPAANESELPLRGFHSIGEGTSNNPLEWLKPHSSTHIVPYYDNLQIYELDKGKAAMCPLIDKPSIVNTSLLFGRDWFTKMQQVPGIKFLPSQCIASEEDESNNKPRFDFYSLKKFPSNSVRDLETMRICTTVDSVEATPGGCPRFSQTTHSVLITKKADFNLSQENDVFRATRTRLVEKTNENTSGDFSLSSPFFGQDNGGVKPRPLSSSNDVRNFEGRKVTIKNESSTKAFNMDANITPPIPVAYSRGIKRPWTNSRLLDTNLELPALPADEKPENVCPANAEQQTKTKSNINREDLDPSNRWVKCLKLRIPSKSNSSSRDTKISDPRNTNLSGKKATELLLSHVWIKRWLRNGSRVKEEKCDHHQTTVRKDCKWRDSKMWLHDDDDIEKKGRFPSIGTMALVRKTMGGNQSCEIQKKGSVTLWNTKAF